MHNRVTAFLTRRWLALPALSALLLPLAFYPFDLWYLGFFALVPLFYFVNVPWYSRQQVFWGGFFTGAVFSVILSFFTLIQFHWLPETYLFVWMVRLSFIPIAIFSGAIGGVGSLLFRTIRAKHPLHDLVTGIAIWVGIEWVIANALSGYDFGLMGYTAHAVPLLTGFASIGGVFLVSAIVIGVNIVIMQLLLRPQYRTVYPGIKPSAVLVRIAGGVIIVLMLGYGVQAVNRSYLAAGTESVATTSISIIQNQQKGNDSFGYFSGLSFSYPVLERLVADAGRTHPNYIIYPFSPYGGIVAADGSVPPPLYRSVVAGTSRDFGAWVNAHVEPGTTFVTWGSVMRDKKPYNEVDFWAQGDLQTWYQKRIPFPFMDYTPGWAETVGLYSIPYDLTAGPMAQFIRVKGSSIGNLLCSELSKTSLARADARQSDLLFAIGSEAMFSSDIAGNFHIVAAQFRAAENNRPIVRADRLGPSAVIDASGIVLKQMDYGMQGVLTAEFSYAKNPHQTIYNRIGDWGFMGLIALWLIGAIGAHYGWLKRFRDQ